MSVGSGGGSQFLASACCLPLSQEVRLGHPLSAPLPPPSPASCSQSLFFFFPSYFPCTLHYTHWERRKLPPTLDSFCLCRFHTPSPFPHAWATLDGFDTPSTPPTRTLFSPFVLICMVAAHTFSFLSYSPACSFPLPFYYVSSSLKRLLFALPLLFHHAFTTTTAAATKIRTCLYMPILYDLYHFLFIFVDGCLAYLHKDWSCILPFHFPFSFFLLPPVLPFCCLSLSLGHPTPTC